MIRTQVRCDKRVSFRDRREGWTCVCPSPGVARTHVATRTESLEPGTLGKHGPGPRHRPYEVAGAKKHQHRLQPRRLSPGVQGHSIKLQQLTNGPCYTLHSVTAALSARSRNPDAKPTAYAALPTYCTGAAADQRTLGPALNRLRGRRLVHQLPRGRLTI